MKKLSGAMVAIVLSAFVWGDFPKSMRRMTKQGNGVVNYFAGLQQVPDPARSGLTTLQTPEESRA